MKNTEEVLARSVILLCLSDRCGLEKSIIGGRQYSKKQREEQKIAITQWMQDKGYTKFMTKSEKLLFKQEIGSGIKDEILSIQFQYEAIEPCLWTLGLVKRLSSYDQFVLNDFHTVLQIGLNHTMERVLGTCNLRASRDIYLQNEISMLWHWRSVECNNPIFRTTSVKDVIKSVFGQQYEKVLEKTQGYNDSQNDFMVNNKPFRDLNIEEKNRIDIIAKWRHHAFEWIVKDEEWDKLELNT